MGILYKAHRVKNETENKSSSFMKNKAVHKKLNSVFSKGIVSNKLCIQ